MDKDTKPLSDKELGILSKLLNKIELSTIHSEGLHRLSGGNAIADMTDYDNEYIDIVLKSGTPDNIHEDQLKINRNTWEICDA